MFYFCSAMYFALWAISASKVILLPLCNLQVCETVWTHFILVHYTPRELKYWQVYSLCKLSLEPKASVANLSCRFAILPVAMCIWFYVSQRPGSKSSCQLCEREISLFGFGVHKIYFNQTNCAERLNQQPDPHVDWLRFRQWSRQARY